MPEPSSVESVNHVVHYILRTASISHAYHSNMNTSNSSKSSSTPKTEPITIPAICPEERPTLGVGDSVGFTRLNITLGNPASE